MKTERYIGALVVLVVGLFLVNASWPETTFAQAQAPAVTTCVQATAPANAWCVPATAGAGTVGPFCATSVPSTNAQVRPLVKAADTAWDVLGAILAAPFVAAQCILTGCP
jgi:hypothetical protein